ncbi:hypothetical protein CAPTEDRAFT_188628 [Capitella teleta]|uniref:Uncharacterized protein n=1 Tax=Capitella teleta TaxID=283909 RepID=R7V7U9_CAPTE|nr:hypothetical protein CAPTEDRAFT_188628 [Capitella teleta]|eukprot:ELU11820.1 hypothetical protein CAPTEDRAFT_188628 [Capitella teleta]
MALLSEQRKQILTEKRVELLNKTSHEQIGELLDHLAKWTESDFEAFCECLEADNLGASSPSNEDVRQQLERCYSRLRNIATAPEWAPEFALDSAEFYISLHLQKCETATT